MKEEELPLNFEEEGVPVHVRMGPASLCAYVGVPLDHPLAGKPYQEVPLECHWGLTFSAPGKKGYLPVGTYWFGWDYAHYGDASNYGEDGHRWTVDEVVSEAREVARQLAKLMAEDKERAAQPSGAPS